MCKHRKLVWNLYLHTNTHKRCFKERKQEKKMTNRHRERKKEIKWKNGHHKGTQWRKRDTLHWDKRETNKQTKINNKIDFKGERKKHPHTHTHTHKQR